MGEIKNVKFGNSQINKIYLGENLVWNYEEPDIVAPTTAIYPDPTLSYGVGAKFWFEVDEICNTYYTLDGTTPTVNSTLYVEPFILNETTDVKYFSVDVTGNAESVKTTTITIAITPVTTISPTSTTQSTIPITVTLSATNNPTTIYYKLGATGTQQTYTAPFQVTQSTSGVGSTSIKVTYWSVNANGTEAENIINYDTSGAMPSQPVVTVTNLENAVKLDWGATENTTSYTVFRSDIQGQRGTVLLPSQWQTVTTYTDTTAIGGSTYYYTVQAGTYNQINDSVQLTGQPIVALVTPVTTINPASTIQNTIPFTVSLSATNNPTAIYYRLGATGTQQTYSTPFSLTQDTLGVYDSNISVAYWSVNASGTEVEKTIIYDTNASQPTVPSPTVINGENQVTLNWSPTLNTTSYSVFRSQVQGTMGSVLLPSQYQKATTYTDTTAIGGQTYYYTVRSANYSLVADSTQLTGLPTAPQQQATTNWRYVKYIGYGDNTAVGTTRLVELKATGGGTNYMYQKLPQAGYATINTGGTINAVTDNSIAMSAYPIWWQGAGIPTLIYDLGALRSLDTLQVWMYSKDTDLRQTKFILQVSTDNVIWKTVADYQNNLVSQSPIDGWTFPAPSN